MDSSSDAMDVDAPISFKEEKFDIAKLQQMVAERDEMEKQIRQLLATLTGPNGPGLVGGLVDKEGFPIADFDKVVSVRENRQKLACLQNDYKLLMKRIEYGLYQVHAEARESGTVAEGAASSSVSSSSTASSSSASNADPWFGKKHFSRVHSVAAGSPAEQSGLLVGDLILQFGSASFDTSSTPMAGVKDVVMNSENRPVEVVVRRDAQIVRLTLVPKKWSGQGLLGCHILPA